MTLFTFLGLLLCCFIGYAVWNFLTKAHQFYQEFFHTPNLENALFPHD